MIEIGVSLQGVKSCKLPLLTSCAGLLPSHRFTIPAQHPLQPASRSSPRNPAARCEMRGGSFPPACLRLHQRAENFLSSLPSTEGARERTRLTALRIGSCWPCRSGDLSEKQVAKKSEDLAETLSSLERAQGPQGIILIPTKTLPTGPCFRTYSLQPTAGDNAQAKLSQDTSSPLLWPCFARGSQPGGSGICATARVLANTPRATEQLAESGHSVSCLSRVQ